MGQLLLSLDHLYSLSIPFCANCHGFCHCHVNYHVLRTFFQDGLREQHVIWVVDSIILRSCKNCAEKIALLYCHLEFQR